MNRFVLLFLILPVLAAAQPKIKEKKYTSLLWEITGKGLKKPSHLFGTMHVSNKMVFQLADSFYLGIRRADVVALETNPESWQEDMSNYRRQNGEGDGPEAVRTGDMVVPAPEEYLSISTLKFFRYDRKIERALSSNPEMINNLLYRSYGNRSADFEEDTYLDMYIYQCGKRWGKMVAGVEKYDESMKLMAEAYRDAARDKTRKVRSYDSDDDYSPEQLQEAYRKGDLDVLDTINRFNSTSAAFDEKFLYRRNEIQASSIDSILRSGQSLFVGVGAAHLPGKRGVIEILRRLGYQLRPVRMGARDSRHKSIVEKLRVPVLFSPWTSADGLIRADIPGKFYRFGDDPGLDQWQYADMANGAYYMVTRVMTNAWMWGQAASDVYKKIDSLLYENVPGRILSKTPLVRNGYRGFAITNKTRRGDVQRYTIFVTPFEVLFFKMSGTGDYVLRGPEADRYFNSIQLREYKAESSISGWKKFLPAEGGFSVLLPHEPYRGNDGSWIFDAEDRNSKTQFRVIRSDIHNYDFLEEDSFDLRLMEESFASSAFIDSALSRKLSRYEGYPCLESRFRDKSKGLYLARFIIQGPHYYTLIAHGPAEVSAMQTFLNSFRTEPLIYSRPLPRNDSALYYTTSSPFFPENAGQRLPAGMSSFFDDEDDATDTGGNSLDMGAFRSRIIANDTTGEKIFVSFSYPNRYFELRDSSDLDWERKKWIAEDSSLVVRSARRYLSAGKFEVLERVIGNTGSSRILRTKTFYRNGIRFSLTSQGDSLTPPSSFVQGFYDSFVPADTLKGVNPFLHKAKLFFTDFSIADSITHQRAVRRIDQIMLDSTDLDLLKQTLVSLPWTEKKYLETKKSLIAKFAQIPTAASADFLRRLYLAAGDTLELQDAALEALLQQRTTVAYNTFRDIIATDPPVLQEDGEEDYSGAIERVRFTGSFRGLESGNLSDGNFLDELYDSLSLTRSILPGLLPLVSIDDYERPVMRLLAALVDSSQVNPADYQSHVNKFLIEAKQEVKKQSIEEKRQAIKKAESRKQPSGEEDDDDDEDTGNDELVLYATLLLPHSAAQPAITALLDQMLGLGDRQLKYELMLLLVRNNRKLPDSLPAYFAGRDDFRYRLYRDLSRMGKLTLFPDRYNNHLDIGRSKLLNENTYNRPDSVEYLDRLPLAIQGKNGFVDFYRYKSKKDDPDWKLAMVGWLPADSARVLMVPGEGPVNPVYSRRGTTRQFLYDYTNFTSTRLSEEEPLRRQLAKELKKAEYKKHRSAREFYEEDSRDRTDSWNTFEN